MTGDRPGGPPHPNARATGVVYLLFFLTAVAGVFFLHGIVISGDPAATARNLLAHEPQFRLGLALGLVSNVCYVALIALLYELLAPVSRGVSLLAAFVGLVGCAVQTSGSFLQLAPLVASKGGGLVTGAGTAEQVQALALMLFDLYAQAVQVALVFFAVYCILIGYLVARSGFLPAALGVTMAVAGLGWLTYLWPPLAGHVSRYVQGFGILAELALMLWLLVRGVNVARWNERAGAGGGRGASPGGRG